jgi:hypothetical protein
MDKERPILESRISIKDFRDFLKDNPNKTRNDAIKYWKIKKSKPGDNKYSKHDLT